MEHPGDHFGGTMLLGVGGQWARMIPLEVMSRRLSLKVKEAKSATMNIFRKKKIFSF